MQKLSFSHARLLTIAVAAALAAPAHADSLLLLRAARQATLTLDTTLWSWHTQAWARQQLNQRNFGLGLTVPSPSIPHLSYIGGAYRNSYDRTSIYGGVLYTPLTWRSAGLHWRAGLVGGLISGYSSSEEPDRPLMAALALSAQTASGWGVRVLFCPAGLAQPLGNDAQSGALGLQLLAPIPLL